MHHRYHLEGYQQYHSTGNLNTNINDTNNRSASENDISRLAPFDVTFVNDPTYLSSLNRNGYPSTDGVNNSLYCNRRDSGYDTDPQGIDLNL